MNPDNYTDQMEAYQKMAEAAEKNLKQEEEAGEKAAANASDDNRKQHDQISHQLAHWERDPANARVSPGPQNRAAREQSKTEKEERKALKQAEQGGAGGGGGDSGIDVDPKKFGGFKLFIFILILLAALGVWMSGAGLLKIVLLLFAGSLFIAEPYLAPMLAEKIKILKRPHVITTVLKVILLIVVVFIGRPDVQVLLLIVAAGFFMFLPSVLALMHKQKTKSGEKQGLKSPRYRSFTAPLVVAMIADGLDFLVLGSIPWLGDPIDFITMVILYRLVGVKALGSALELLSLFPALFFVDPVPIHTLVVLTAMFTSKKGEQKESQKDKGPEKKEFEFKMRKPSGAIHVGLVILILIVLLVGGFLALNYFSGGGFESWPAKVYRSMATGMQKSATYAKHHNPVVWFKDFWRKSIAMGAGRYYEGKVEKNREEKLGVYLTNLEAADPEFYEDEEVIVWANLKAFTLDKPINASLSCSIGNTSADSLTPSNNFSLYKLEERYLECKFNRETVQNTIGSGAKTVSFDVNYNFKTMSYVKSYFMDQDRLRSMRREEINPLREYGIKDRNPMAVYTNGPVKIGMDSRGRLPVGIGKENYQLREAFVLGITLENRWKGKIRNITKVELQLPDSLDIHHCDHPMKPAGQAAEPGHTRYLLNLEGMSQRKRNKFENIKHFQSWKCWVDVKDRDKLLGDSPISTKYIRLTVEYEYQSYEDLTIHIRKVKEVEREEAEEVYSRGCCQVKQGKCSRERIGCNQEDWFSQRFCGAEGECISCQDVCNTRTQCPATPQQLTDHGWCCPEKCSQGSLLYKGAGHFDPSISDQTYKSTLTTNTLIEERLTPTVLSECKKQDVDYFLAKAIIHQESQWDPKVIGYDIEKCTQVEDAPAGVCEEHEFVYVDASGNYLDYYRSDKVEENGVKQSYGIAQMTSSTADILGCNVAKIKELDAEEGVKCGIKYIRVLVRDLEENNLPVTVENVAAGYNAGFHRVKQYGGVPPFAETESYVNKVRNTYNQLKTSVK